MLRLLVDEEIEDWRKVMDNPRAIPSARRSMLRLRNARAFSLLWDTKRLTSVDEATARDLQKTWRKLADTLDLLRQK